MVLDHLILNVNDMEESIRFYTEVLGMTHEGKSEPFQVIRVSPDFELLLGPWPTEGGEHLAFAMPRAEFDAVVRRVRERGIPFGDTFDAVGNMKGPHVEARPGGARGLATSLYFFDPNKHLLEIRHYEQPELATASRAASRSGAKHGDRAVDALALRKQPEREHRREPKLVDAKGMHQRDVLEERGCEDQ